MREVLLPGSEFALTMEELPDVPEPDWGQGAPRGLGSLAWVALAIAAAFAVTLLGVGRRPARS